MAWRETRRTRDGAPVTAQDWQATDTVFQVPPADEATLLRNPMGLYVTAFGWSQRLSGDPLPSPVCCRSSSCPPRPRRRPCRRSSPHPRAPVRRRR
ncbi:type IV secretion system protein [Azospirillum sp. RWY-5-1]|uniref:Type IV secretion system protein n=1 Tax=Azospirillum oleiclasticum TaxID=2735135 RepID=A0ABX2TJD0_9PROT|nr:type IV secretion system protein [Azospirillum oleiclasticum]NYZ23272.1 type IV secretion system protein [Azospirillum oleiclasticum]